MNSKPLVLQTTLIAILKKHPWDYSRQLACEVYIMVMQPSERNIIFLDFYLTLFPTSPIFSSKRQFRVVLGSKAALLKIPLDLVHTHTSKRPEAYFQVFCTLRLGATSEAAVFPVNSLVFSSTDPSKASTRELWAGASVPSYHQG